MFRFAHPQMLLCLLLVPLVWYLAQRTRRRSVAYSSLGLLEEAGLFASALKVHGRDLLRLTVLVLLALGLARPQTGRSEQKITTEGVDIMLVLDISGSMQAQDFKPKNRLHVAKEVVKDFIARRPDDRIGLVIFAAQAMTQCPLTLDHDVLRKLVDQVRFGMLEDRTAIGVALATACNRLRTSKAKSKVVVLLTDGQNNAGMIDPPTAAKLAQALGIKVYTVGVGSNGVVPVPVEDPFGGKRLVPMEVRLDEETLRKIADTTGGRYFRATNREELAGIYDRIDKLEKTKIESKTYVSYTERFHLFALPALVLLGLEVILGESVLREVP